MNNFPVSEAINETQLFSDEIIAWFTPKPLRKTQSGNLLGYLIASLPSLLLILPLVIVYSQTGKTLKGILFFLFLLTVTVGTLILVSFGKRKAITIVAKLEKFVYQEDKDLVLQYVTKSLVISKQIISGALFSIPIILIAQGSSPITNNWLRVSVSISVAYAGFLAGAGFYLVLCIVLILRKLTTLRYKALTLFPSQAIELKQIANLSASISLLGALIVGIITGLILLAAPISGIYESPYWIGVTLSVLFLSWVFVSIPFAFSQFMLNHVIEEGKKYNLSRLNEEISELFRQIGDADKEMLEKLEKLQSLYAQVYQSPNTVIDLGIISKYISSLLLTIIPSVIGSFFQNLLP